MDLELTFGSEHVLLGHDAYLDGLLELLHPFWENAMREQILKVRSGHKGGRDELPVEPGGRAKE
jgi:hypothetical protein